MEIGTLVTITCFCLLAVVVLGCFLVGFWRGMKRSAVNIGVTAGVFLLSFFLAPVIAKALLNGITLSIGGTTLTLNEYLLKIISETPEINNFLDLSPSAVSLVEAIPLLLVNLVVFAAALLVFGIIGYIVYKIISVCCFKSKSKEKILNLKRNRWGGACMSAAFGFAFMVLTIAPFSSLAKTADVLNSTASFYQSSTANSKIIDLPAEVINGVEGFNNSLGKVTGVFGLDNAMFDQLTKTTFENKNLCLRKDALTAIKLGNTALNLQKDFGTGNISTLKSINWEKMDEAFEELVNGGLLSAFIPNIINDFVQNYDMLGVTHDPQVETFFEDLKEATKNITAGDYYTNDLKVLYNIISSVGSSGLADVFIFENTKDIYEKLQETFDSKNKTQILEIFSSFFNINVLKDSFESASTLIFEKILDSSFTPVGNVDDSSWNIFKNDTLDIVDKVVSIVNSVNVADIADNPATLLDLSPQKASDVLDIVGDLVDSVNDVAFLKDASGNSLLDFILNNAGLSDILTVDGVELETYKSLTNHLKNPVFSLLKLDLFEVLNAETSTTTDIINHIAETLSKDSKTQTSDILEEFLLPLMETHALENLIFNQLIPSLSSGLESFIDLNALTIKTESTINRSETIQNWESEIMHITKALVALNDNKIADGETSSSLLSELLEGNSDMVGLLSNITGEELSAVLKPVLYAKSTTPLVNNILKILQDNINAITGASITITKTPETFVENSPEDQADELCNVLSMVLSILPENGNISSIDDLSLEDLGALLDNIKLNAYRVELSDDENPLQNEGLLKPVFESLIVKIVSNFPEITAIKDKKEWYELNFTETLALAQELKEIADLDNITGTDENGETIIDKVEDIIKKITPETEEQINNIIDMAETVMGESTVTVPEDQKNNINSILDSIGSSNTGGTITDSDGNPIKDSEGNNITFTDENGEPIKLEDETINNIKEFLGLTTP